MARVHIGLEPADDEPDERPDRLGQALLDIKGDPANHGRWWTVATAGESWVRAALRRLSGKVDPPGVPGMRDLAGWEARMAQVDSGWQLRVRYSPAAQDALPLVGVVPPPAERPSFSPAERAGEIANRAGQALDPRGTR